MLYMTVAESSERWGVSPRQVQRLLAENRIPGARKHGRAWMIPAGADKPADPRRGKNSHQNALFSELAHVIASTSSPLPAPHPDAILGSVKEGRARLQYQAELAYLRDDFAGVLACFRMAEGDDAARLRASIAAVAAAISTGDYQAYTQIEAYLKRCMRAQPGGNLPILAELVLSTAAVNCIAPNMAPECPYGILATKGKPA